MLTRKKNCFPFFLTIQIDQSSPADFVLRGPQRTPKRADNRLNFKLKYNHSRCKMFALKIYKFLFIETIFALLIPRPLKAETVYYNFIASFEFTNSCVELAYREPWFTGAILNRTS